jgi:internalin A
MELIELGLSDNLVEDISPLKRMSQLKYLDLDKNKVNDLTPLTELKELKSVYIYGRGINDISQLVGTIGPNETNNINGYKG